MDEKDKADASGSSADMAGKLHPLERKVLPVLAKTGNFEAIVSQTGLSDIEVMRALQWLQNKTLAKISEDKKELIMLDRNGQKYSKHGLPERRFLASFTDELPLSDIVEIAKLSAEEGNLCIGLLRKKAAIEVEKRQDSTIIRVTAAGRMLRQKELAEEKFLELDFPLDPASLDDEQRFAYSELRKRKEIIRTDIRKTISAELTSEGKLLSEKDLSEANYIEKLTPAIIRSGMWKKREFRHYDVSINVPKVHGGKRHFVSQAIEYIRRIWLDMGFVEMKGNLVQTGFWNLDSLYVPQDHPAREMQDTFYIKDPRYGKLPKDLYEKISKTHEDGWTTGSRGWQYKYSEDVAKENMLRTHTTVLSAQTLSKLKKGDLPAKFFSVKKVFRNETLSWKHLFEFIQVEGIVVDPNANFKNLIGYLKEFFSKLGYPDARVRPGHFPYTEPSAEVDVWHPGKKQWVELGGSGMFRPEVTKPLMGFECPVLAWGLGLERSISEYYDIKDIRDLYRNDIAQLRDMKVWMK